MKLTAREYLLLVVIAAASIALRMYGLGLNGLWYDEVFSAEIARLPALDLVIRTANDVHPPLYYLLLRGWNLLTGSEADGVMRGLSAVLDLCGMGATAWLAWVVFKQRTAVWLALAVHAFSPFAILYAQELRMYSLLLLVSTLSIGAMFRLAEGVTRGRVALYVVATLAALYTHIFAVFLVVAQSAWFFTRPPQPGALTRKRWFWLQVGLGVGYLPWAWVITKQMLWAKNYEAANNWWIPVPPPKALIGVIHVLLGTDWFVLTSGALVLGLVTAAILLKRGEVSATREQLVACLWIVALPIAIAFGVSYVTTPVFVARFFTEVLPALWVLVVAGLLLPRSRAVRVGLSAVFLAASARAIPALNYSHSFKAPTPYREIVAELSHRDATIIIDSSAATAFAWRWYTTSARTLPGSVRAPLRASTAAQLSELEVPKKNFFLVWPSDRPGPERLTLANGAAFRRVGIEARAKLGVTEYAPEL